MVQAHHVSNFFLYLSTKLNKSQKIKSWSLRENRLFASRSRETKRSHAKYQPFQKSGQEDENYPLQSN